MSLVCHYAAFSGLSFGIELHLDLLKHPRLDALVMHTQQAQRAALAAPRQTGLAAALNSCEGPLV
jgi:hypothetical protein